MPDLGSGPKVSELHPFRLTRIIPCEEHPGFTASQDRWESVDFHDASNYVQEFSFEWKGFTVFIEKEHIQQPTGRADGIVNDGEFLASEATLRPRSLPAPHDPSEQERELHNLTHLPFRRWCSTCVQGKGKHSIHPKLKDRKPVIQVDYAFLSTKEEPGVHATILTAIDVRTQLSMAIVIPSKKASRYAVTELKRFIYETGRTQAILQCDDESSIKALLKTVISEIGGLAMRVAPTGSSQSQGSIERFHQTLFGQFRTLRVSLLERLQLRSEACQSHIPS